MCLDLVLVRKQSFLFQFSLFQSYEHSWIITCLHPSSSVAVAYPNVKTCQCVSPSVISLLSVYCACPNFSRREREERGGGGGGGAVRLKSIWSFCGGALGYRLSRTLSAVTYFPGVSRCALVSMYGVPRRVFSASRKAKPKVRTRVDYADWRSTKRALKRIKFTTWNCVTWQCDTELTCSRGY